MAYELALRREAERAAGSTSAVQHSHPKVTVVHKSNVLSVTDGLFRETVKAVGQEDRYKGIKTEEQLVDSMVYRMFREPE